MKEERERERRSERRTREPDSIDEYNTAVLDRPRNEFTRASFTMRPWSNKSLGLGFLGLLLVVSGAVFYFTSSAIFHYILQKVSFVRFSPDKRILLRVQNGGKNFISSNRIRIDRYFVPYEKLAPIER